MIAKRQITKTSRSRQAVLCVEPLEDRVTPSIQFGFANDFGGSGEDRGIAIAVDEDDGSIVTVSQLDGAGLQVTEVAKYSSAGVLDWSHQFTGTANYMGVADTTQLTTGIAVDSNGAVYVAGSFQGEVDFNNGDPSSVLASSTFTIFDMFLSVEGFVVKFDSNGTFNRVDHFQAQLVSLVAYGGAVPTRIAVDDSDNVIVVGAFGGAVDFDPGGDVSSLDAGPILTPEIDGFALKLNSSGTLQWVQQIERKLADDGVTDVIDGVTDVAVDAAGDVYVTGVADFSLTADNFDSYIRKLNGGDGTGTGLDETFLSSNAGTTLASGIALDSAENIYVTGAFADGVNLGGTALTTSGASDFDIFLAKFDSSFSLVTATQLGATTSNEFGLGLDLDDDDNVYLAGAAGDSILLEFTTSGFTFTFSDTIGTLHLLDDDLNLLNTNTLNESPDTALNQVVFDVAIHEAGATTQINTTGFFEGEVDFDPAGGEDRTAVNEDGFVWQLTKVNDPPVGTPTIIGSAVEDQTLTADTGGISDGDGLGTFSYQWLRDGVPIAGATSDSYMLGDDDVGKQISVRVSYIDGLGTAESVTSALTAAVANINDPPVFVSVPPTSAEPDVLYTYNVLVTDADPADALAITAPTLPGWLTLTDNGDGTALLQGTPTSADAGVHNVVLNVFDGTANVQQPFTINVSANLLQPLATRLVANDSFTVIGATGSPTNILSVKIFDGAGNLVSTVQPFNNLTSVRVAAGDFDGDGRVDEFAVLGRRTNSDLRAEIVTYDLSATGQATETGRFDAFGPGIFGNGFIAAGDFDGDGDDDLAVAQIGGGRVVATLQLHISGGAGFSMGGSTTIDFGAVSAPRVGAGDSDGDGSDEIVMGARTPGGAGIFVFDGDSGTPVQQGNGFTWDFGVTGYSRGAFVAIGEFDPTSGGEELILGSNVGGGGRVDIVSYDGIGSATLVQNGRLTPFGDSYDGAVRVTAGRLDDRAVIVAGQDRFQAGQYTIMARQVNTAQSNPPFDLIPPVTALTAADGLAPGGLILGPFVAFANATHIIEVTGLLAPSLPGADLLDGDPDDIDLAFAVDRDRSHLGQDELDELFSQF